MVRDGTNIAIYIKHEVACWLTIMSLGVNLAISLNAKYSNLSRSFSTFFCARSHGFREITCLQFDHGHGRSWPWQVMAMAGHGQVIQFIIEYSYDSMTWFQRYYHVKNLKLKSRSWPSIKIYYQIFLRSYNVDIWYWQSLQVECCISSKYNILLSVTYVNLCHRLSCMRALLLMNKRSCNFNVDFPSYGCTQAALSSSISPLLLRCQLFAR